MLPAADQPGSCGAPLFGTNNNNNPKARTQQDGCHQLQRVFVDHGVHHAEQDKDGGDLAGREGAGGMGWGGVEVG